MLIKDNTNELKKNMKICFMFVLLYDDRHLSLISTCKQNCLLKITTNFNESKKCFMFVIV